MLKLYALLQCFCQASNIYKIHRPSHLSIKLDSRKTQGRRSVQELEAGAFSLLSDVDAESGGVTTPLLCQTLEHSVPCQVVRRKMIAVARVWWKEGHAVCGLSGVVVLS